MPDSLTVAERFRKAWNVFLARDQSYSSPAIDSYYVGPSSGYRLDKIGGYSSTTEATSIINSVYNRIGIDVAAIGIKHARVDQNGRFIEEIDSGLNNCLTLEANIDQSARAFIQDVIMSTCEEGAVAIVPIDTTINPTITGSYDILSMRTGKILQWYPEHVRVNVYNQNTGMREDITLPKKIVAIVENPLYAVMNEPNSTLKRLLTKLQILDVIDNQSGSGKLDLLIQLPYTIRNDTRQQQAEKRRETLEAQLAGSKYGIGYVDATEKITQLNRPAENNLLTQIEYLTRMLWSQLGLTKEVFDGTADDEMMINYYNRTIEPFLAAVTDSMKRSFLTKTGRSQGQTIMALRDPFKFVAPSQLAELADKFTRNEILTSNEFRGVIGYKPSSDPKADELRNKNLNQQIEDVSVPVPVKDSSKNNQNGRSP